MLLVFHEIAISVGTNSRHHDWSSYCAECYSLTMCVILNRTVIHRENIKLAAMVKLCLDSALTSYPCYVKPEENTML